MDQHLGTVARPGNVNYVAAAGPLTRDGGGNSNSAAYAVPQIAEMSEGSVTPAQPLPPGGGTVGAGEWEKVLPW